MVSLNHAKGVYTAELAHACSMEYNTQKGGNPPPGQTQEKNMLDKAIRFIILAVLVGAAVVAAIFVVRLVFRLLIIGAVVLAILALVRGWNRGAAKG